MSVGAGDRDTLITFQRPAISFDGYANVETFADYGNGEWAARKDISDGERWRAGEVQANITTRYQVLRNSNTASLTTKDRLIDDGVTYDIVGIKRVENSHYEITAAARPDA